MIWQKLNNLIYPLSGKLKRSPTEVFCSQESGKSVMQFYKNSYMITTIITRTQGKVPNTKGFTKPVGVLLQHVPKFRRQQRDKVKPGCPRTGDRQQQFCWVGAGGEAWLQLLSTETGLARGAEAWPSSAPLAPAAGSESLGEAAVTPSAPGASSSEPPARPLWPALTRQSAGPARASELWHWLAAPGTARDEQKEGASSSSTHPALGWHVERKNLHHGSANWQDRINDNSQS